MTPAMRLTLDSPTSHYQPGEQLRGRFMVDSAQRVGRSSR